MLRASGLLAALALAVGLAGCGGSTSTITQTEAAAPAATQTVTQIVKTVTQTQSSSTPAPSTNSESDAGNNTSGGPIVPYDILNRTLDDAEDELEAKGISFSVDSGPHVVILRGDWGVCSTTPTAGQSVNGAVVLHVGHFSCGA